MPEYVNELITYLDDAIKKDGISPEQLTRLEGIIAAIGNQRNKIDETINLEADTADSEVHVIDPEMEPLSEGEIDIEEKLAQFKLGEKELRDFQVLCEENNENDPDKINNYIEQFEEVFRPYRVLISEAKKILDEVFQLDIKCSRVNDIKTLIHQDDLKNEIEVLSKKYSISHVAQGFPPNKKPLDLALPPTKKMLTDQLQSIDWENVWEIILIAEQNVSFYFANTYPDNAEIIQLRDSFFSIKKILSTLLKEYNASFPDIQLGKTYSEDEPGVFFYPAIKRNLLDFLYTVARKLEIKPQSIIQIDGWGLEVEGKNMINVSNLIKAEKQILDNAYYEDDPNYIK